MYEAETVVTGQGEAERLRGLANGLAEVVAKLSGDAASIRTEDVQRLLPHAAELVERYEYEDRMKGIPIYDEQGTRERPYYLRMQAGSGRQSAAQAPYSAVGHRAPESNALARDQGFGPILRARLETESGYGQREVGWVEREGVANFVLKL